MTTTTPFRPTALVADGLSLVNAACGVGAIFAALRGRPEVALLLLLVAVTCDALDGAAARRFGSTPWGVWSDDVADAISYGVAPAFVVGVAVHGAVGAAIGVAYALFTFTRLAYFTATKGQGDPAFFAGVPSPVGGLLVTSAAVLFPTQPALVGAFVGVACAEMVAFDAAYRHLGRWALADRRRAIAVGAAGLASVALGMAVGPKVPAAALLALLSAYVFAPTVARARQAFARPPTR